MVKNLIGQAVTETRFRGGVLPQNSGVVPLGLEESVHVQCGAVDIRVALNPEALPDDYC